ncbi:DUF5348 domain-containing protein [Paenibacillus sp. EKM202P]|uniref:DUF5348 domain-containing protein n=2 Tax=unclassified Paenibacillus TaxID=185978 RepID=UPI0013EB542C|nr:DUF5348 domain-containing protein [Paenibacillus sp. EKM202P]KAF6561964.1 DUF5348 domain-containing protein [Paenibacillus sp. EKM202P]KAF6566252.1 DUF5348 domain-containing protein [Paenibacillus sp. EKM207P]
MNGSMKNKITVELEALLSRMQRVSQMIVTAEENWTAHYNRGNPDDQYLRGMFCRVGNLLDDAKRLLDQTFAEVVDEGILTKNVGGRYALHGREFTSGQTLEYQDQNDDGVCWELSRIEHNGYDYYLVDDCSIPLEGLRVRYKHIAR